MYKNKIVINLKERPDRLVLFKQEIKKLFPDGDFILIEGETKGRPIENIISSFKNAINYAKSKKWESVLILEDDCVFLNPLGALEYLDLALANIPEPCDILLGGIYNGNPIKITEYWSEVSFLAGTHFGIYRQSSFDKILNYDFEGFEYDRGLSNICKCLVLNRFIATQRGGYSNKRNREVDDSHYLTKYKLF